MFIEWPYRTFDACDACDVCDAFDAYEGAFRRRLQTVDVPDQFCGFASNAPPYGIRHVGEGLLIYPCLVGEGS